MLNMASSLEDKKNFICNFEFLENENCYKVNYADGHSEKGACISPHNYECYLQKMEEQYYKNKESYLKRLGKVSLKKMRNIAISTLVTLGGFYLSFNMDIHVIVKILLVLLMAVVNFGVCLLEKYELILLDEYAQQVEIIDYYLNHKEEFVREFYNDEINEKENILLINLNNIDAFKTVDTFNRFVDSIKNLDGDEIKKLSR